MVFRRTAYQIRICANRAPQKSSRTSRALLVREGTKLWCISSMMATERLMISPISAQRSRHKLAGCTRDARNYRALRMAYSVKCADLRTRKCRRPKVAASTWPKIHTSTACRIWPVFLAENVSVEAARTIVIQATAGSQYNKMLLARKKGCVAVGGSAVSGSPLIRRDSSGLRG